jgi:hypothetical protein
MAGRPRYNFDWEEVTNLLRAHASGAAVARLLGIFPDTLYNAVQRKFGCNFDEFSRQKKEEGIALVKLAMYNDALAGAHGGIDRIFWLKNCAGWSDRQNIMHEGLAPVLQINIAGADAAEVKQIENIFNGKAILDAHIPKELGSIQERIEVDR